MEKEIGIQQIGVKKKIDINKFKSNLLLPKADAGFGLVDTVQLVQRVGT